MDVFYDSAQWSLIQSRTDAALYNDGQFRAPVDAPNRLGLKDWRWITVTGDWRKASIVDYEKFNPVYNPAGLRGFVRGRRSLQMDAIVYCNESTAAEAIAALRDFGHGSLLEYDKLFWWIATLDEIQRTPEELCQQLAADWDAPEITIRRLWGNQWGQVEGGQVDISNRFLDWRPATP